MYPFFDSGETLTVEKFVQLFLETQMTFWFARFNLPQENFEITMINVLQKASALINEDSMKDVDFNEVSPILLGMAIANDPMADTFLGLFDGKPITPEKLEEVGVRSVERTLTATHLFKEFGY